MPILHPVRPSKKVQNGSPHLSKLAGKPIFYPLGPQKNQNGSPDLSRPAGMPILHPVG